MKKLMQKVAVGTGAVVVAASSQAAIDYTSVTGAITAGDITVGVLAIAGILAIVNATMKGAKMLLGMLKGA